MSAGMPRQSSLPFVSSGKPRAEGQSCSAHVKITPTQSCQKQVAVLQAAWHSPHVLVLRDQHTIQTLAKRLPGMQRVVLVGNGGIALEVAHALTGVEVGIWHALSL